jgi:hypothetical protein
MRMRIVTTDWILLWKLNFWIYVNLFWQFRGNNYSYFHYFTDN